MWKLPEKINLSRIDKLDTVRNEFFSNKPHDPEWCTQRAERKQKNSGCQECYTLETLISTIL